MPERVIGIGDRAQAEVEQLHQFFQDWFNAALPQTDEAFARFESVLAPSFEIIPPTGAIVNRRDTLEAVRRGYGSGDGSMKIAIRNHRLREHVGDVVLVVYEEWQTRGDETKGHVSSALLRMLDDTPNGLQWLHVHETGL